VALRYLGDDITYNADSPEIPNLPQMLARHRARWPGFTLSDGEKYNSEAFPPVK
jgi:hypothetical protein